MKTRMTHTSLVANYLTDKPTAMARIYANIFTYKECNYKQIATNLGMSIATVTGRLNELMYDYQLIKVSSVINNMQIYSIRSESDPLNIRPKSVTEQLEDKINAIQAYLGLSDAQLEVIIQQGKNNLFAKV